MASFKDWGIGHWALGIGKNPIYYSRLQLGEVQIIVGAQHVVPLPVYFIYLQYAVGC
ncbi:MAG: hypothetical protein V7K24_14830 [Nostoc sp.]